MPLSAESDGYSDLETAIRVLAEQPSARRIALIAQDNAQLREENKKLAKENNTFPDLCKRFMHEAEQAKTELDTRTGELENLRKEKQAADTKLADKSKSLEQSIQQIVVLEAKHEEHRSKTENDLKRKTSELERLRTCFLDLKVTPSPESLGEIFKSLRVAARDLASTYFGYNLPTEVLAQSKDWTKISEYHSEDATIPFILANSLLAKQTRTALVISVLGFELCQHIFQPTYLSDYPGVNKLLTDLAGIDPYQECHLRSVLLKTTQAMRLPQGNPKGAAKAITTLLSPVVETSKRSSFELEVTKLCQQALETWRDIQTWDILVIPNLGSSRAAKRKYRWQSFTMPTPTKNTTTTGGKQRANNPPSSPPPTPADETPIDLLTGTAVWPAFINLSVDPDDDDGNDDPTLAAGYILPASVISDAEKELAAAAASAAAAGPVSPTNSLVRSGGGGGGGGGGGYLHREQREVERGVGSAGSGSGLGMGGGGGKRRRSSVVSGGSGSSVVSGSGGGGGNGKKEVGFLVNGQGAGSKGG